jgi:hypothetical protein
MKKKRFVPLIFLSVMFLFLFSYKINVSAMNVYVNISIGTNRTFEVEPTDTIQNLKGKIQDQLNIPPETQVLVYEGVILDDVRTLSDYGISPLDTIDLQFVNPAVSPVFVNNTYGEITYTLGDSAAELNARQMFQMGAR